MITFRRGDYLIQLKNASMAGKREVVVRDTKHVVALAAALKKLGFLEEVTQKDGFLTSRLTFHKKRALLMDLKLISTPGLRIYANAKDLANHKRRSVSLLISTPQGVMSDKDAVKANQGGEVLAEIM